MRANPMSEGWRCGAPTKSGAPCTRRVDHEGFRCPHHPPLTAEDRAAYKAVRLRVFAKQEAAADLRDAERKFVRIALEHEQLSHPETQKAFDHLVQLTKGAKS